MRRHVDIHFLFFNRFHFHSQFFISISLCVFFFYLVNFFLFNLLSILDDLDFSHCFFFFYFESEDDCCGRVCLACLFLSVCLFVTSFHTFASPSGPVCFTFSPQKSLESHKMENCNHYLNLITTPALTHTHRQTNVHTHARTNAHMNK